MVNAVAARQARAQGTNAPQAELAERLIINNDLARLKPEERIQFYRARCEWYGLDWRKAPFDYLNLQGKLTLYLNASGADQMRERLRLSVTQTRWEHIDNLIVATVTGTLPDGRTDTEIGAVPARGLQGEALANAVMKALTKAKRRLTLSMGGMGGGATEDDVEAPVVVRAREMDAPVQQETSLPAAQLAEPPARPTMTTDRLTPDQQEAMFNAAAERNVGGVMPVDTEQEPSTQTWGQVVAAITEAWVKRQEEETADGVVPTAAPEMGVLKDGRLAPGRVWKAMLALPIIADAEEV